MGNELKQLISWLSTFMGPFQGHNKVSFDFVINGIQIYLFSRTSAFFGNFINSIEFVLTDISDTIPVAIKIRLGWL